ncbi:MAG TPA: type VI immunity family protein [Planctomycetota bacterium]|jgi:hypothetical protein|nr:type VI immunity family protein [Planctomycetota bacterium]
MAEFDFNQLIRKHKDAGEFSIIVRPGITANFYSTEPIHSLAPVLAKAIEATLAFIPQGTLKAHLAKNGFYKPLSPSLIQKFLKTLKDFPKAMVAWTMDWSEALDGDVGTHAIFFQGSMLANKNLQEETNILRLEFPPDVLETVGTDKVIAFLEQIASFFPFQTAHAGYAFKRSRMDPTVTAKEILKMLPRYSGFDPSYANIRYYMRNHTFTPQWITLLDEEMTKKAGGLEKIRAALPKAEVRKSGKAVLIRAAERPPIGDMNRKAKDIGLLPDVARLLAPTRIERDEFDQDADVFDAAKWLARFDKLKSLDWKNA